jgi:predicted transposase/invertase (TIGR01784 family)
MKKDIVAKEIIKEIAKDISIHLLGIDVSSDIKLVDKEFTRVEKRESDIVFENGKDEIIHIEIQNNNHSQMHLRMLRYYSDILFEYEGYRVLQYVIYIGKRDCKMKSVIKRDNISYSFEIIDLQDMDCEKFLFSNNPSAVALSILCNFQNRDKQTVVNTILARLKELSRDNEIEYRNYLKMINILSSNRDLEDEVAKGAEMLSVDIEKTPFYKMGIKKGIKDGLQKGIEDGVKAVAKRMIEQNIDISTIQSLTTLSLEEINKLKKEKDEHSRG